MLGRNFLSPDHFILLQDTRDDREMLTENTAGSEPRKKLPDYDQLRKDAVEQHLKIVSYFRGKTEFDKAEEKAVKSKNPVGDNSFGRIVNLPLVDKHAQGALRRRIVNEQLDRVLVERFVSMVAPKMS